MVKMLHNAGACFNVLNIRNESVLQIAVLLAGKFNVNPYFDIIKYLIEVVDVDLTYNYEETLLLC
jgi:hypothetical protein